MSIILAVNNGFPRRPNNLLIEVICTSLLNIPIAHSIKELFVDLKYFYKKEKMFPNEYQNFEFLAEKALTDWVPDSVIRYRPLKPGYSGATVLKVDISAIKNKDIASGQYILKLSKHSEWANQDSEIVGHKRAFDWDANFSKMHIRATDSKGTIFYYLHLKGLFI